jgi:hypothetical protein
VAGGEPLVGTPVKIDGDVYKDEDISAVIAVGPFLVIASDERSSIQVLREVERGRSYRAGKPVQLADEALVRLADDEKIELDLEGLAVDGQTLYVLGSHSRKRSRVRKDDTGRSLSENRRRMERTHAEDARNWLFQVRLDDKGAIDLAQVRRTSLRGPILADPILGRFWSIPGKENGVDIEAIAVHQNALFVGFRSPVLRRNWVPVLVFEFDGLPKTTTRFVNLDGLGVRGLETVEDRLLLLAGPAGDAGGEFFIYLWDGREMLPGKHGPEAELSCLGRIKPFPGGSPESIARIATTETSWEVLIAFDGVNGQDRVLGRFEVPRHPGPAACE